MSQSSSVLQDWVMALPLREQGTLLTGVRGCDLAPKLPLDSTERRLTAFLRYCFLNPADPREVGYEPGAFFQPTRLPRSPTVQLGLADWSSVLYALARFAFCQPEERKLPHDRALFLLKAIDGQVQSQMDRSPDGG